jgi:hypothetical protein
MAAMLRTAARAAHIPLVAEMPHGGFKHSTYGKDLSLYGFEDYTRINHVMSKHRGPVRPPLDVRSISDDLG